MSVGRGVASLGAAAPVGQALSEAAKQATAAQLVAQLQVVTGRPGVYMMCPEGPQKKRMESSWGGHRLGLLWGWVVSLHWVVWRRFWVPRWIQGLGPIWGLGLRVWWQGFEQSCSRV